MCEDSADDAMLAELRSALEAVPTVGALPSHLREPLLDESVAKMSAYLGGYLRTRLGGFDRQSPETSGPVVLDPLPSGAKMVTCPVCGSVFACG